VRDRRTKAAYPLAQRIGHRVATEARRRGLVIRPLGNVVVLMPPLSVTVRELERMGAIVHDSIRTVTEA
jgi:adenosylmethionine-8-amino-7-oxononanoate aminotransferase